MASIGTASVGYNFKSIPVVNKSKDFIDIVLSKTQRKTPTVVHARYAIKSIREFYMRKVKFAQQTFHDKLSQIIEAFPRLEVGSSPWQSLDYSACMYVTDS
jgi:nucleolar GTP-binding protein